MRAQRVFPSRAANLLTRVACVFAFYVLPRSEFFPSEDLPILVYFKETQTPADKWDVGPGQWANGDEALAKGAVKGQVHFFPCIAKAGVLKENFVAKNCAKL